ncbi:winged helix-turn-helix domain-containing protein [uncultured Shewanella sp.]|uniref:winged helix-turn-helix domain-containing protein n=1 Tax=uncultured Shewanella sp. TaxID=173975 RepID=UPI00261BA79F|nr:winged helix-turn-helix domain-containing protein [uncultured Shewanella sp.]
MFSHSRFRLADRLVDPRQCTIIKGDTQLKIELRAMQVLVCLIKYAGKPVSRDMLLQEVWAGGEVSDNAISRIIRVLRSHLGDDARAPEFIKTLPKVGYILIAPVIEIEEVTKEQLFTSEVMTDISSGSAEGYSLKRRFFAYFYCHFGKLTLFIGAITIILIWGGTRFLFANQVPLHSHKDTELQRLTYLEGQEFNPVLSPDGKFLAFSQRESGAKNWRIGLMNLESRSVSYLNDPFDSQSHPAFHPDGSKIAYISFNKSGECELKVVELLDGQFNRIDSLTGCKRHMQATSIVWAPSGNSLFYIDEDHQFDYFSEKKVFSIHANGSNKLQISQPYSVGRGDYALSLSPDGRYLGVLRNVRWYQTQVMLLALETGTWQNLFEVNQLLHTLAWGRESQSLIYRSNRGHLTRYDLEERSHSQLTNIMQTIISPISNQNGDLVAVLGEFNDTEVWQLASPFYPGELDSTTGEPKPYISSSGRDKLGAVNSGGTESVFVSNRTGVPELWFKASDGVEKQISHFNKIYNIRDISFSVGGNKLLGRVNNNPFVYEFSSDTFNFIKLETESEIYNVEWGSSSDTFIAAYDESGKTILKLVSVESGKTLEVLVEGGEFGKFSEDGLLYYTKRVEKGLWMLEDGEEVMVNDGFRATTNMSWTIVEGYLYNLVYSKGGYFLERLNLSDGEVRRQPLPYAGLRGNVISVDKQGRVFLVFSKPRNTDVIAVNY